MVFFLPMTLFALISIAEQEVNDPTFRVNAAPLQRARRVRRSTEETGLKGILDMCLSDCQDEVGGMGISNEDDACLKHYTTCLRGCLEGKISSESRSILATMWRQRCEEGAGEWMAMVCDCGRTDASKVRVEDCDSWMNKALGPQSAGLLYP